MHLISDDDLRKFLRNELPPDKARKIARYLKEHPESSSLYGELLEEWELTDGDTSLMPGVNEEMHSVIIGAVRPGRPVLYTAYIRWAAAAAVLLICFGGYLWWKDQGAGSKQPQQNGISMPVTVAVDNAFDTTNNSGKAIALILSDGSRVTLYPNSRLHYFRNVTAVSNRDLYLDGKASFDVAKNEKKTFTVYTGMVSTTVLGTNFSIVKQRDRIEVKLYSGKVLLKKEQSVLPGWEKNLYLAPGESMLYDALRSAVKIDRPETRNSQASAASEDQGDFVSVDSANSWNFRSAPLGDVLNKLKTGFDIAIDYNSSELNGMRFTGTVRPSDSPALVLNMIANLNSLKITKAPSGFKVEKIK
ncbi:MAG TPA: FecR family protein [Puia sp.]|jgi:ferric-dicitrate binding protein FerR (iron transport regulator)